MPLSDQVKEAVDRVLGKSQAPAMGKISVSTAGDDVMNTTVKPSENPEYSTVIEKIVNPDKLKEEWAKSQILKIDLTKENNLGATAYYNTIINPKAAVAFSNFYSNATERHTPGVTFFTGNNQDHQFTFQNINEFSSSGAKPAWLSIDTGNSEKFPTFIIDGKNERLKGTLSIDYGLKTDEDKFQDFGPKDPTKVVIKHNNTVIAVLYNVDKDGNPKEFTELPKVQVMNDQGKLIDLVQDPRDRTRDTNNQNVANYVYQGRPEQPAITGGDDHEGHATPGQKLPPKPLVDSWYKGHQ